MLVKLHGTSGSGKSTVGRFLLTRGTIEVLPNAYKVQINDWDRPLFILGLYNSQCGGCDTLAAGAQIELIHKYAPLGHVFYESLLGSEYYGKLGEATEPYGRDHVFAFLDTPINECIKRVKARRWAKGNTKPLNEDNTRNRVQKINNLRMKLQSQGRNVVMIHYVSADQEVFDLYKA